LAIKRLISGVKSENLTKVLKDLETQGDDELKNRCRSLYGTKPPQKIHRSLLIAAVAHRMQENALGALKSSVRRHLMQPWYESRFRWRQSRWRQRMTAKLHESNGATPKLSSSLTTLRVSGSRALRIRSKTAATARPPKYWRPRGVPAPRSARISRPRLNPPAWIRSRLRMFV
jgi:hypothetical protein